MRAKSRTQREEKATAKGREREQREDMIALSYCVSKGRRGRV
jgi:hypothetical protein